MPPTAPSTAPVRQRRVAVVGCGVSGLGAAYVLGKDASVDLTLYEARSQLGGHANTVMVRGSAVAVCGAGN